MPKVVLDCAGVLAVVCELVAAGMPQHVTVNEEGEARGLIGLRGSGRTRSCMPRDHELAGSQAVAVGDQDGGGIPMAPAVFAGSLNELLDFPLGKVLARPSGSANCYIYCHWGAHPGRCIFHCFPQCWLETVTVLQRCVTVLILACKL